MTSVVLVDTGGTVVEYVTAVEDPQQEGECEVDLELEGEVEGECEAEEAYEEVQDREEAEDYPAVIVEEVPGASLAEEQSYSAQVLVYDDEAYLMQEVGDEQEVETESEWRPLSMAPVSTVLTRPLRLQRLCYAWTHPPASEKTAVQKLLFRHT